MMHFSHRTSNAKLGDSFKRQQETWRRAYAESCSLRERFPQVEQLVVDMTFTDVKEIGRYSAQMRSFSASAKAFFAIACPRTLCLDGGFDLNSIILDLLGTGDTASMGTLECRGWVDPKRSEHARCLLRMHYRIQVLYDTPEPSRSKRRARV
jgi:hypothetical protein